MGATPYRESTSGHVPAESQPRPGDLTVPSALDARKAAAVACLVAGATHDDAATAAGVCRKTIGRWRRDPRFVEAIAARRRELVVVRRELVNLLDDPATERRHKVRLLELLTDPARRIGSGDVGDRQLVLDLVREPVVRRKRTRRLGGRPDRFSAAAEYRRRIAARTEPPECP